MSFNLGNWADQLQCEMCSADPDLSGVDLSLPSDYNMDDDFPDDFWDPDAAPDPSGNLWDNFELPQLYPTVGFPKGNFTIGVGGSF